MNKLFKLIYVNLLSLFDINKIIIAREDGVKSNLEKRVIITGIISLFYGYLLYKLLIVLNVNDKYFLLNIGFIIASLYCFITNLSLIGPAIFKSEDTDILFSFPVTRYQILFSKLFTIYLKNLLTVGIVMFACILSFYNFFRDITDTMVLMYILGSLVIPLIPMVLATIITYFNDYFKIKYHNDLRYKILKGLLIFVVLGLLILVFKDIKINNINVFLEDFMNKVNFIYPLNYLFYITVKTESILALLGLLFIPVLIVFIYMMFINNNYLKICSMLKGIKKKDEFIYKKTYNMHKVFGIVRKEFINLFSNKNYLFSSYGSLCVSSLILVIFMFIFDFKLLENIKNIDFYINLYIPSILGMIVTMSCSTISSMSLEKNNLQILRTMPISMEKVILGKWLTNVIIGSIFVIINGSIASFVFKCNGWGIFFNYLLPFVALLFVSFTGIVLDYRFIEKTEMSDNVIIRQRLLNMVPGFISIIIGVGPFFVSVINKYQYILGSYILMMIIGILLEVIYLIINKKKLLEGLFN